MRLNNQVIFDHHAEVIFKLIREIMGDECLVIETVSIKFWENFETNRAKIQAKIIEFSLDKSIKLNIEGEGVGLIDAYFDAMIKNYESQYSSLDQISIVDFHVKADIEHGTQRKSDAKVTALLRVKNADNFEYAFEGTSFSISHSSVLVVQGVLAFFINAEKTYKKLHFALGNAKERGRFDLVERFQNQMATIVKATSYEKLVHTLNAKY